MPISVTCDCGRSYRVTEKHAGKKFRCKSCGERVTVPTASGKGRAKSRPAVDHYEDFGDDDFDDFEDYEDDDYELEDDYGYPPRTVSRGSSSRRSKRRRKGMPISVMVAVAGEGILIPANLLSILGSLVSLNPCSALFFVLRIAFEIVVIVGFVRKQRQARLASIILSAIGLVFSTFFLALVIGDVEPIAKTVRNFKTFIVIYHLFQMAVYCTLIGCLLTPSATRHFDS